VLIKSAFRFCPKFSSVEASTVEFAGFSELQQNVHIMWILRLDFYVIKNTVRRVCRNPVSISCDRACMAVTGVGVLCIALLPVMTQWIISHRPKPILFRINFFVCFQQMLEYS